MKTGAHEISHGSTKREMVEITECGKKKVSRTFHQKLVNGKWVNSNIKTVIITL